MTTEPLPPFRFRIGTTPLLVSMPHCGVALTDEVAAGLTEEARHLPDTDWYLPELYDFLEEVGASVISATYSRYVVDLNRPPDDTPLYASSTTGLFPTTLFDGSPLFRSGCRPDDGARTRAFETIWRPYHAQLADELDRIKSRHGHVILFDAHSIRSRIPWLFESVLPDFNIGTADGASADSELAGSLLALCLEQGAWTAVLNGRFKGGHITRHYGDPEQGVQAIQLEMAQRVYMEETPPYHFDAEKAAEARKLLRLFVGKLLHWTPSQ